MLKTMKRLVADKAIHPPPFMLDNMMYLCQMGSVAYGTATEYSDVDVYGFCVPPKSIIFPHIDGNIAGFDEVKGFDQWSEHHIKDNDKEYDFTVYTIIKYFVLVMQNNPNMIDSLFVPRNCILHSTQVSEHLRENRRAFLHRGAWFKFKGYAYSQMTKMRNKKPEPGSKRELLVLRYGYDVKFAVHLVRLLCEIEQILVEGDLDLQRHKEQLKSIRNGEWSEPEVIRWAEVKELQLEQVYHDSSLSDRPDRARIKRILLECLEMHYGSLAHILKTSVLDSDLILQQIRELVK